MTPDYHYHGPVAVFDLDDTLIGERDFCRSGFAIIEKMLLTIDNGTRFSGLAEEMSRLLEMRLPYIPCLKQKLSPDLLDKLDQILESYSSTPRTDFHPLPDVDETMQILASKGVRMALVTDGRAKAQRNKIKSAGLDKFFLPDLIFISEEEGHDKSQPHSFSSIVRLFPEAKRFTYIGDNPAKDILQPSLLGWDTIIVASSEDAVHSRDALTDTFHSPTYRDVAFSSIADIILRP